jgi:hypothetical protein
VQFTGNNTLFKQISDFAKTTGMDTGMYLVFSEWDLVLIKLFIDLLVATSQEESIGIDPSLNLVLSQLFKFLDKEGLGPVEIAVDASTGIPVASLTRDRKERLAIAITRAAM